MSLTDQQPVTGAPAQSPQQPPTMAGDLRTFVTISRRHDEDVRQRQILVRIDDGPTQTLMYGDACTIEVRPGAHVLRANNTLFWKKASFVIESGEHLDFAVVNRAGRLTFSFLTVMGVAPLFLTIERRSLA